MSRITDTCVEPGCGKSRTLPAREADLPGEVAARAAHAATAHPGEDVVFHRTERWAWLWPLAAVNVVTLILSAAAAASWSSGGGLGALTFFLPVVWGSVAMPLVAAFVALVVLAPAVAFTLTRPPGTAPGPRFFAAVTMGGFVALLVSSAVSGVLMALIAAAWSP